MFSKKQRSLEILEWSHIQDALSRRARSAIGQAAARIHAPFESINASTRLRLRVAEGLTLLQQSSVHGHLSGTTDTMEPFERAARDGVLEPSELFACGHFMSTIGLLGEELRARSAIAPLWASDFFGAPRTPPLCEIIARSVSSDNSVLDTASSELSRLRRERLSRRAEFELLLEQKVKEWHGRGLLQDSFYDVMDGRYVVPVKIEQQSKLDGVLFGKSNTGQSVFIEPPEITAPNNELKQLDLAIRAEEYRILRTLSAEIGRLASSYAPWVAVVGELDLALAAAALAKDWELKAPITESGHLRLLNVFHPGLLERSLPNELVRNSYEIEPGGHAILISGPNTGGKTVLLKATALAAAMASSGLFVPADEGSLIPHYAAVLAFIGDEQSLAAGLSSFSAQIIDMKRLIADERFPLLVVIDEMLSSTDPEEASALAQSLIEELIERGHHVLVTSHFSELSIRSRQNPRITVAAMEFDEGRPTYRLRLDELGSSHALDIAARLGLPQKILSRARGLVSTAKLDYERAQASLKRKEAELAEEQERVRRSLQAEQARLEKDFEHKLKDFMESARRKLDETVQALSARLTVYSRQGLSSNKPSKTEEKLQATAKDALNTLAVDAAVSIREATGRATPLSQPPAAIAAGDEVKIRSMRGSVGRVLEILGIGAAATAKIQIGAFRFERPVDDLQTVSPQRKNLSALSSYNYVGVDASPLTSHKLDLRGRRYDEALSEAERYVDQAYRSGLSTVTIITGHGTGALKKGLKELLTTLPYVKDFRPERSNDDGATLIEFDR